MNSRTLIRGRRITLWMIGLAALLAALPGADAEARIRYRTQTGGTSASTALKPHIRASAGLREGLRLRKTRNTALFGRRGSSDRSGVIRHRNRFGRARIGGGSIGGRDSTSAERRGTTNVKHSRSLGRHYQR